MQNNKKCTAVIVAGGSGKRMGTSVSKQFLELQGQPILAHTLRAFQNAEKITQIVLVVPQEQCDYVKQEIVKKYAFDKTAAVVSGGAERYDSVYRGILACDPDTDIVYIHDGVRPFIDGKLIEEGYQACIQYGNAVCGVPSKDTVKVTDDDANVVATPDRAHVWSVQTPQIFRYREIKAAYEKLQGEDKTGVTDDAMVMEKFGNCAVHMYTGSYRNIKITTPEDLEIAEVFLK